MVGHLKRAPGDSLVAVVKGQPDAAADVDVDVDVYVDERELGKLDGFQTGTPVVIEAVVVTTPSDGVVPASYPAFQVGDVSCGLTAITSPPPEKDTTVVRLTVGQRISLRITA